MENSLNNNTEYDRDVPDPRTVSDSPFVEPIERMVQERDHLMPSSAGDVLHRVTGAAGDLIGSALHAVGRMEGAVEEAAREAYQKWAPGQDRMHAGKRD
jgi:hypothetical protein